VDQRKNSIERILHSCDFSIGTPLSDSIARSNRHGRELIDARTNHRWRGRQRESKRARMGSDPCGALFIINDIHALVNSRDFHSVR